MVCMMNIVKNTATRHLNLEWKSNSQLNTATSHLNLEWKSNSELNTATSHPVAVFNLFTCEFNLHFRFEMTCSSI
jgi:hypothetical protein